jgi:hypothetical protein
MQSKKIKSELVTKATAELKAQVKKELDQEDKNLEDLLNEKESKASLSDERSKIRRQ